MAQTGKKAAAKKPAARRRASKQETPQVDRGSRQMTDDQSEPVDGGEEKTALSEYRPKHPTLENADLDQGLAEEKRQIELQDQRDEHNARTHGFKY